MSLDGIAKTFDPQAEDHDTFQLVTTATSGTAVVKQDTVSGALIEIPANPAVMMRLLLKHG